MRIDKIDFNASNRIWHGEAVSTRGQRYKFGYQRCRLLWCDRQVPWQGNGTLWSLLGAMPRRTLIDAIRHRIRKQKQSRPEPSAPVCVM